MISWTKTLHLHYQLTYLHKQASSTTLDGSPKSSTMALLSTENDDSDATLRPLAAPLRSHFLFKSLPPAASADSQKSNPAASSIEISSPIFDSEPPSPIQSMPQPPLPWYQRLLKWFSSPFAYLKRYLLPPQPTQQTSTIASTIASSQLSPTSSISSGFVSPSKMPPPIVVPPPPSDVHLNEYFPPQLRPSPSSPKPTPSNYTNVSKFVLLQL